jgi:SAM-dependent methyltransferase
VPAPRRFKDYFSEQPGQYARHRPRYPGELFRFLASCSRGHARAWDCATGNGQAAIALAEFFDDVIATDASTGQIGAAITHPKVTYRVAAAEDSQLGDASADLVTVGQALHWFDTASFFAESARVLVPGGVLAIWCYELCRVNDTCDTIVDELYADILGAFWSPERRLIEVRYAPIEMPGTEIETPQFHMTVEWTAGDMLGYLRTWSACNRYRKRNLQDPVSLVEAALCEAWGDDTRTVSWPLTLFARRLG